MPLTAGVIGCGMISRFHFDGLQKIGVKVKRICDRSEAAAKPWTQKTGAQWTPDRQPIIDDPEIHVVEVLTNSPSHAEICLAAIAAGKSVICEKTLATTLDDAVAVTRAALQRNTIFYTSYMKRFLPAMRKAKELLPSIGQVISSHFRVHQLWGDCWGDAVPAGSFLSRGPDGMSPVRRNNGGGILFCGGSHLIDLVSFLLGRPTRVYAEMLTLPGRDFDNRVTAMLTTPNGPAHLEAIAGQFRHTGLTRDGWDEHIEIIGANGILRVFTPPWDKADHHGSLLLHYDHASGQQTEYRFPAGSPFATAVAEFYRSIECGQQTVQSPLTGYEVDEVIHTIYRSAAAGQAVDVDWKF